MNDKALYRLVGSITVFVCLVVAVLDKHVITPPPAPEWVYHLATLNAVLNGSCTLLLLLSLYFIRKKNIMAHKRVNLVAFTLSTLFLVSYITYHFFVGDSSYGGSGAMKGIYYFILITHIILAIVVLPLVLLSFQRGLTMQVEKHRKLVRWTFPVWLYVTASGVVVYLMMLPYYKF